MIPQRIIQTGPSAVAPILRSAIVNVRLLHSGFEHLYFDDAKVESFTREEFPELWDVYQSFPFAIQKYDFFRYLAIYRYGGFYLDLDVFLVRDVTPLLGMQCVFPFEELTAVKYLRNRFGMDWQVGNYAFGAAAGNPFLAAIIDNCVRAQKNPSWVTPMMKGIPKLFHKQFYVLNTTGPGVVSRTLAENPKLAGAVDILFPEDVRDPRGWHQFGAFGVHQMAGSWRGRATFVSASFSRLWDVWTLHRILVATRNQGKTRVWKP